MKFKIILLGTFFSCFLLAACVQASSNCSSNASAVPCVDMSGVDTTAICTAEYDPVCGCDNKTYGNSCAAAQAGVQAWVEGECCP